MNDAYREIAIHAGDTIKTHSRSFYWASRLLPRNLRQDAEKLYAWCRWCDDAVDKAPSRDVARRRVRELRQEVERMDAGREPHSQASRWLAEVKRQRAIPTKLCEDLIDGMQMDATGTRLITTEDLLLYSYRVAGSVGLMMCHVLRVTSDEALPHACSLGIAMQLTNIARDIGEDRRMGRCYIPAQWMSPSNSELTKASAKQHVARLLNLADEHYRHAEQGLRYLPFRARIAIGSASEIYRAIGAEIKRHDYDAVTHRAVVPARRKLHIVLKRAAQEITAACVRGWRKMGVNYFFPRSHFLPRRSSAGAQQQSKLTRMPRALPSYRYNLRNFFLDLRFNKGNSKMKTESRYLVSLGLSLTLLMATGLFVLVGLNPKDATYASLPWAYAAATAVLGIALNVLAKHYERQLPSGLTAEPVTNRH